MELVRSGSASASIEGTAPGSGSASAWVARPGRLGRRSQPKRSPERLRDAIFDSFGGIWGSIFVAFRRSNVRATRLAAQRAEMFLLAGAALQRVRSLSIIADIRRKSSKIRIDNASRSCCPRNTRFFRFRTRLGVDFGCFGVLWTLLGAPSHVRGRPWGLSATLLGVTGRLESVPGTMLDRFYMALPRPGWLKLGADDSPNDRHNEPISTKND